MSETASEHEFHPAAAGRAKKFWPTVGRLIKEFAPYRWSMVAVVVLVLAAIVLNVAAPIVLGQAMNLIYGGALSARFPEGMSQAEVIAALQAEGETDYARMLAATEFTPGAGIDFVVLSRLIMVVLMMYFVAQIFDYLHGLLINHVVMRIVYGLRARIEDQVNRLPLSYFDSRQRGDLLSRTTNDVDNVQNMFQQALTGVIYTGFTLIGITVMMFVLSWQLALIALIALPLAALVVGVIGTRSQKLFTAQWRNTGKLNGHVEESYTGHQLVTVFGRSADMRERFDELNEDMYQASFKAQFYSNMIMPIMQWVSQLGYVGIAVVGGLRVASGQMTLGAVTAFIQYSREFNQPLGELTGMANMVISGAASAERIYEFLDAGPEHQPAVEEPDRGGADGGADSAPVRGHIRFENVEFSYARDPGAPPLITDLNLEAKPGQTVAIVGPTGAGKTTLVNLLMRFYEVDAGRITLDGVDISTISRQQLRAQIGMVLQDAVLFSGTIADNIRYGRLDATDEEVMAAAQASYVDRFVATLPDGYDTEVSSDGGSLSAGERQLITIARAFLKDPAVLILDEATSSVDTRTEKLIQDAMAALRSQRTSFVIAHRLSTIRDADLILVMESGRIVEQGDHDQLMSAKGAYYRLYMSQFAAGG